jgi:hypothetical protein
MFHVVNDNSNRSAIVKEMTDNDLRLTKLEKDLDYRKYVESESFETDLKIPEIKAEIEYLEKRNRELYFTLEGKANPAN